MTGLRRLALVAAATSMGLGVSACSSSKSTAHTPVTSESSPLAQQLPITTTRHAVITDSTGSPLYIIDVRGPVVVLNVNSQMLTTSMPVRGRRRYTLAGKDLLEVRSTADGFAVAVPGGVTKWTVAKTTAGTEIRKGDDKKLYVLVPSGGNISVDKGSKGIGVVERQANGTSLVKDSKKAVAAKVTDGTFSAAYGVTLAAELPNVDRGFIMAELLAANQ